MKIVDRLKKHFAGKYEFIELIGKGGFAEVHLAKDKLLEREVAVKVLLSEYSNDPEINKRFLREAKLYAKLEHENLIPIYDTGIADGHAYIIMKYIKGESLKLKIIERGKISIDLMSAVIRALANALGFIHSKGIVHRDIKPANILIEEETQKIYLADFGIARTDMGQTLTQSGLIIGTPSYISPEQIRGKKIDHRADIYAFGAMLYELATGKPVFSGDSSIEILYQHVNEEPEPIASKAPGLPKEMKYIISKCIEKKPEDRFQNAAEILDALERKRVTKVSRYLKSLETRGNQRRKKLLLVFLFFFITIVSLFVINSVFFKSKIEHKSKKEDKKAELVRRDKQEPQKGEEKKLTDVAAKTPQPLKKEEFPRDEGIKKEKTKKEQEMRPQIEKKEQREVEKKISKPDTISTEPIRTRFTSYPLGADVYWEDEKLGNTAQAFYKLLPPGEYTFTFVIEGYERMKKVVTITPDNNKIHQKFVPYGTIMITCMPFANIKIDGKDYGSTPLTTRKISVGEHTLELTKPGYKSIVETIEIKERKHLHKNYKINKIKQEDSNEK